MAETDVAERLRAFWREVTESDGGESPQMAMTREAVDEIERLRSIEEDSVEAGEFIIKLKLEIERLRAELGRLRRGECICIKCGQRQEGEKVDGGF